MLVTILATAVVLGVLILVHELGHFWAAKAVDVEVTRFSIGFGPPLLSFQRGETEYVLAAFPLGGYVKMAGMGEEEAMAVLEGEQPEPHEPGARDFDAKPLWARFMVLSAGVAMNFLFAVIVFAALARTQGLQVPLIDEVFPGTPAAEAGFRPGDLIVAVEGESVNQSFEVGLAVEQRAGEEMSLVVERQGERIGLEVRPEPVSHYSDLANDTIEVGRIGVAFNVEGGSRTLGWGESLAEGWNRSWFWVAQIGSLVSGLFTGEASARELGGPILIGQISGEAARAGLWPFLGFMAIISVNLAVLNLLPIPVLDGGFLLFLGVEAIRGRALSVEQRLRLTQVGLVLVVGLMVWAFANDIMRLLGV